MKLGSAASLHAAIAALCFFRVSNASLGDRLPEFKNCVKVCEETNCGTDPVPIPFHHRLLLWTCPAECDYTCQHIVTDERLARDPPYMQPVHQFHGKWPFWRFLGMQEPFSVLFSLANFWAHWWGMSKVRENVPEHYPLRRYYEKYAYLGYAAWTFSAVFHARDFLWTERFDYLGAGAYVLYGLYFAPIRIFRLYEPGTVANPGMNASLLRIWTGSCLSLYAMHAGYLLLVEWNYTYNMAANIVVGLCHSIFWAVYSLRLSFKKGLGWRAWPGFIVAMVIAVMALELLDFPPWGRMIDAHSLWHLGTVLPTMWWYKFLVKDAQEDLAGTRLKQ